MLFCVDCGCWQVLICRLGALCGGTMVPAGWFFCNSYYGDLREMICNFLEEVSEGGGTDGVSGEGLGGDKGGTG